MSRTRPPANSSPLEAPAYSIPEVAHYLNLSPNTLRYWALGGSYQTASGHRRARAIISMADSERRLLSFLNLVELHVLAGIRRKYGVNLRKVRRALDVLKRHYPSEHPLADQSMMTNGKDLFLERYGLLINLSQEGQIAFKSLLERHLKRIERGPQGLPIRLFPFTRMAADLSDDEPRPVVIDPTIAFGRPTLVGTGIPTTVIADRYKAGESILDISEDYGREASEIEEAIRCELQLAA